MTKDDLIRVLFARLDKLTEKVKMLEGRLRDVEAENAALKSILNSNSTNSSKPPSSDGYRKKPAFPKERQGKQGGQQGHQGNTLQQVKHPDKIVACSPDKCSCGHEFSSSEMELSETRQVFDLPEPKLEVTEYQIHQGKCPVCGEWHKGSAPEGVNAPVQYGHRVKAFVVLLNVHFKLPLKKIQLLFGDLFGYHINASTVYSATGQCYEKLQKSEEIMKTQIAQSDVAHADETGLRVAGKLHWLHTATTLLHTYLFVHENRGGKALESEKSILNKLAGWLVHDCWSSYFNFSKIKHAICGAHILRELEGLAESGTSPWSKEFKVFLLKVYRMSFEERLQRRNHIETTYAQLCDMGGKWEPPPVKLPGKRGRYKRTKGRNLLERLVREREAVLAFAFNKEVPFTNNLAERDIRPAKVKQKISNCFRTVTGAEIYARIEGFISTARKNNRNAFTELRNSFNGHNFLTEKLAT